VAGTNILTVGQNNVTHPPGVKLKQITPETIRLDLDITARKRLPIQVDWTGELPEGMLISGVEVEPDTAEVTGAKGFVDGLSTLYTVKVQVDDLAPRGELSIPLALRPASVSLVSPANNRVRIRYTMSKRQPVEDLP
jgi:YbbR domain-containing protein